MNLFRELFLPQSLCYNRLQYRASPFPKSGKGKDAHVLKIIDHRALDRVWISSSRCGPTSAVALEGIS
jgi:hypothetical protein